MQLNCNLAKAVQIQTFVFITSIHTHTYTVYTAVYKKQVLS